MAQKGEPHTSLDSNTIKVTMVEVTDDSLLFAESLVKLREMCISMECFQFTYGWMTAWEKSEVSIFNADSDVPSSVQMPSIDPQNPSLSDTVSHPVPVRPGKIIFLRTPINDEAAHYHSLLSIIDNFSLPKFIRRLPLTAIRKIFNQLLISKLHAQIALHPITPVHASALDSHIMAKIHF